MTITQTPATPIDAERLAEIERTLQVMLTERVPPSSEDDGGIERHLAQTRSLLAALARIVDGTFGRCRTCDDRIAVARLEIVPTALACAACASAPR